MATRKKLSTVGQDQVLTLDPTVLTDWDADIEAELLAAKAAEEAILMAQLEAEESSNERTAPETAVTNMTQEQTQTQTAYTVLNPAVHDEVTKYLQDQGCSALGVQRGLQAIIENRFLGPIRIANVTQGLHESGELDTALLNDHVEIRMGRNQEIRSGFTFLKDVRQQAFIVVGPIWTVTKEKDPADVSKFPDNRGRKEALHILLPETRAGYSSKDEYGKVTPHRDYRPCLRVIFQNIADQDEWSAFFSGRTIRGANQFSVDLPMMSIKTALYAGWTPEELTIEDTTSEEIEHNRDRREQQNRRRGVLPTDAVATWNRIDPTVKSLLAAQYAPAQAVLV